LFHVSARSCRFLKVKRLFHALIAYILILFISIVKGITLGLTFHHWFCQFFTNSSDMMHICVTWSRLLIIILAKSKIASFAIAYGHLIKITPRNLRLWLILYWHLLPQFGLTAWDLETLFLAHRVFVINK